MTETEQVKALAELDGLKYNTNHQYSDLHPTVFVMFPDGSMGVESNYLDSYDAIIPLIQKQPEFASGMMNGHIDFTMTPSQLCEALLRATRKWKE